MVFGFGKSTEQKDGVGAPGDMVKDTSTATFAKDVLETSRNVPVLVDFWAPWCGPCKQLTPILEKVVRSYKGKVRLVKINIDENQAIAAQLRIQSHPDRLCVPRRPAARRLHGGAAGKRREGLRRPLARR